MHFIFVTNILTKVQCLDTVRGDYSRLCMGTDTWKDHGAD